nr:hypothetical protein [Vibrio vulnificus]
SAHLPQKLLLYAYQPNAKHQYQRIPASRIRRDDDRTITLLLNSDDAWLQPNASGQPQLTLALAENTLGDVAREQHAGSSAG